MDYDLFLRHAYNIGVVDVSLNALPKDHSLDETLPYYLYHENWPGTNCSFKTLNKLLMQTVGIISMEAYMHIMKLVEYSGINGGDSEYYPSPLCLQSLNVATLYDFLVQEGYL